jgi:hypothetical protein
MSQFHPLPRALAIVVALASTTAVGQQAGDSPADHLPPHISQLTSFGERADWSHDGKKILFLSKTLGDAMEIDLAKRAIRNLTAHYPNHGYTRALYLANGDILLSGPETFDLKKPGEGRSSCFLYVLDKSLTKPPTPLGVLCSEGPAVSRRRMHIAWAETAEQPSSKLPDGSSRIEEADIVYENGTPKLAGRREVLDSRNLSFRCTLEPQNFHPPDEKLLTFSAYGPDGGGADVGDVEIATKKVTKFTDSPDEYDEPEGIFPDGQATLVECDRQNHQGSGHVDLWKLAVDGSGKYERLTFFSDYPGYKASNPVVSDDGRYIAFQMAKSGEAAGVGHGIFVYDVEQSKTPR